LEDFSSKEEKFEQWRYNRNISMLILKLINDIISVRKETADGVSQLPRSIL
jgi:hypothetical protein